MPLSRRLLLGLWALAAAASARVNATGAVSVFLISDCDECTKDEDSIFCFEAASDNNFVSNITRTVTIRDKKQAMGAGDGARYCWDGAPRAADPPCSVRGARPSCPRTRPPLQARLAS